MKNIAFALAFILTVSAGYSQQRKRMAKADTMTPEQRVTLSVKRMALQLDLSKDQTTFTYILNTMLTISYKPLM